MYSVYLSTNMYNIDYSVGKSDGTRPSIIHSVNYSIFKFHGFTVQFATMYSLYLFTNMDNLLLTLVDFECMLIRIQPHITLTLTMDRNTVENHGIYIDNSEIGAEVMSKLC